MGKVDITARTRAVPFVPFRVICADGTVYLVAHPEMVMARTYSVHIGWEAREHPRSTEGEDGVDVVSYFRIQRLELPDRAVHES